MHARPAVEERSLGCGTLKVKAPEGIAGWVASLQRIEMSGTEATLFGERLMAAIEARKSCVVVGLDPHLDLFPPPLADASSSLDRQVVASAVERFCLEVIEVVADVVPAVKPQVAFFERLGPPGWSVLEKVVAEAKDRGLIVILDAKRGDIGSTASAYADYFLGGDEGLGGLDADAVTLNPYLGSDSLAPFAAHLPRGKGFFILAKTSNPASFEIQDRQTDTPNGKVAVYSAVGDMADLLGADFVGRRGYSSVGLVVGATSSEQATSLRNAFPQLPFLVPGYGAQGAGPRDVMGAFDASGGGALVNASRSLLFAYREEAYSSLAPEQWSEATRLETLKMTRALNDSLAASGRSDSKIETRMLE